MNRTTRHRLLAATALAALLAGGTATAAPLQRHDDAEARKARREHRQDLRQDARQDRREDRADRHEDRRETRQDHRDARQDIRQEHRDVRQDVRQEHRDIRQDVRQAHRDYRQDRRHDWREDRREDARRAAYARYRHDYDRRMRSVQVRIVPRYYVRPAHYRYGYGGRWYTTSNYGAELLRMAVQNGYREGLRAGRADRHDRWPGGYRDSFAWRDAGFGYGPGYVSRADYAYYFRQGFERGYEDGYYGRMRYGRYADNDTIILETVLGAILSLQRLR